MKNNAFTLAETLATLAIMGVLAAILIPVISSVRPDENRVMFKKAYYVTERIISELVNDEELYPYDPALVGFRKTTPVVENGNIIANGNSKLCTLFSRNLNTIGRAPSCNGAVAFNTVENDGGGNFKTTDGIVWSFPNAPFDADGSTITIQIDTNGPTAPNCRNTNTDCSAVNANCKMPDRFDIIVASDGKMSVTGCSETEYLRTATRMR